MPYPFPLLKNNNEREHIHISGDSSPICKRHLESMLKGIKSYLCLVQTGHADIEEFRCGRKGESRTFQTKELSIIEYGKLLFPKPPRSNKGQFFCLKCTVSYYGYTCLHNLHRNIIFHLMTSVVRSISNT